MPRWFDRSRDPNAPDALADRSEVLRRAKRVPVADRIAYLRELCRGRRVLDIGVVDHDASKRGGSRWLHRELASVATSCIGVDVLDEELARLEAEGYKVQHLDITREVLDDTFDLVIAGEVLEHVGAPLAVFEHAGAMLDRDGRFVLTTPNPFALHRVWRGCRGDARDSVDHVAYYAPSNIVELAERSGLVLDSFRGVRLNRMHTVRGRAHATLRALLRASVLGDEIDCETIVYECVRAR